MKEVLWPVQMALGRIGTYDETRNREGRRLHVSGSGMGLMGHVRTMPAMVHVRAISKKRVNVCFVVQSLLPHLLARETWWLRREGMDICYGVAIAVARVLLCRWLRSRYRRRWSSMRWLNGLPHSLCSGRLRGLRWLGSLLRKRIVAVLSLVCAHLLAWLSDWFETMGWVCGLRGRARLLLLVLGGCRSLRC